MISDLAVRGVPSNTVALMFTAVGATDGSQRELAGQRGRVLRLGLLTALGGATGAGIGTARRRTAGCAGPRCTTRRGARESARSADSCPWGRGGRHRTISDLAIRGVPGIGTARRRTGGMCRSEVYRSSWGAGERA
jgi:hypothetical protein